MPSTRASRGKQAAFAAAQKVGITRRWRWAVIQRCFSVQTELIPPETLCMIHCPIGFFQNLAHVFLAYFLYYADTDANLCLDNF